MVWDAIDRRDAIISADEAPVLTDALREAIFNLRDRYPTREATLLPAMLLVQREFGCVSPKAVMELAEMLDMPAASVLDAMSFYSHLFSHPVGRHVIVVCRGLSCELCGAEELLSALKQKLAIEEHQTTADGRFTIIAEECLGACERAAYLLIDDDMHGPVRADRLDDILDAYP